MLKCISMFESFCCMHNWGSYCKRRVALQKCPIFLLEREREREGERDRERARRIGTFVTKIWHFRNVNGIRNWFDTYVTWHFGNNGT